MIDGHLRRQEAIESGFTEVPVLVVDLDENSELAALASIDSITNQADVNDAQFADLLRNLGDANDDLIKSLVNKQDEPFGDIVDPDREGSATNGTASAVHLVPGEQYNYVMLLFRNDLDWLSAIEHFGIDEPARDLFHGSKVVGRTRVVDGSEYLRRVLKDA